MVADVGCEEGGDCVANLPELFCLRAGEPPFWREGLEFGDLVDCEATDVFKWTVGVGGGLTGVVDGRGSA